MASKYDIKIDQGASLYLKLTWKNPDRSIVDTTGYTGKMQIRTKVNGEVVLELNSSTNEIIISNDGVIELVLTSIQTMEILTNGVYDLIVTSPLASVKRLMQGNILLSKAVTV